MPTCNSQSLSWSIVFSLTTKRISAVMLVNFFCKLSTVSSLFNRSSCNRNLLKSKTLKNREKIKTKLKNHLIANVTNVTNKRINACFNQAITSFLPNQHFPRPIFLACYNFRITSQRIVAKILINNRNKYGTVKEILTCKPQEPHGG